MSVQAAPQVHPFRRTSVASALVGLLAVVIGVVLILAGGPVQATPPGNNGTVKIVGVLDDQPQNQPHVPCSFSVEWFGFDSGATSVVDFSLQSPTSDGTMNVVGDTTPTLDGNGYGLEAYTLSFTGEPQPNQGFHVKMVVSTTGSQGNDTKSKVFWVGPCGSEPTPTVTPTETPTETVTPTPTPTETVVPPTETPTSTPSVAPPTATVAPPAPTTAPTSGATVSVPSLVEAGLTGHKVSAIWGGGLVGGGLVALLFAGVLFLSSRRTAVR